MRASIIHFQEFVLKYVSLRAIKMYVYTLDFKKSLNREIINPKICIVLE
jgi:hypothetical protein